MKTNTIQLGDNLEVMRGMDSGCIDLIATDPPFNIGKDWVQFNDKWEGGMKGYLKFMEPRLQEMHRLLKDTGSIYLHCGSPSRLAAGGFGVDSVSLLCYN